MHLVILNAPLKLLFKNNYKLKCKYKSLEKIDTRDVNGVRQNKGLRLQSVATTSWCAFLLPNLERITTYEPVSPYNQWEVTRPTRMKNEVFEKLFTRETLKSSL